MHHSLAEVNAETLVDSLRDVEAKRSAYTLANKLVDVKAVKVCETLTDIKDAAPL